ncbi:MAG TPA: hypothetical protein VHC90_01110 [Bryobacteraceae bacterium]|nr:hypothetical protein [Bryobacteraceae bacterium]
MTHECDPHCENRVRLDAAVAQLEASTALLMKSVFSGTDDSIEVAYSALRVAKVKFTSARATCREQCRSCDLEFCGAAAK